MLNCAHVDRQREGAAPSRSSYARYAIYYTPQPGTALAAFGRSWFGRANDGVTLQAFSDAGLSGTSFAKLLVGYRDGRSYVRMPDDLQAWAVDGAVLPPLQRGARWLDLDVVAIAPQQIADVLVRPAQGPAYRLIASEGTGQQFALAPPYASRRPVTDLALAMAGQALARFSPVDVARADTVATGAPLAEHVTRTRSGVAVVLRCWRANDRFWVTLGAAAGERASGEAVAEAQAINERAAGWAFALTELDWKQFSLPLSELVE